MRTAFFDTLVELAAEDERICLLTGDLGFGVIETFARRFPDRFINAGIAEQNMTGLATGMALSGRIVFTYSIGNFPTLRCLEQIRNGPCYHKANVIVVSVGGGLVYGSLGMSHHVTEDLAIMRSLPNLTVVAPGDPVETRLATRALVAQGGPGYLRLGRAGEPTVHSGEIPFKLGSAVEVRPGDDCTLFSTGGMLVTAVDAAARLAAANISCRVVSMHTVRPIDRAAIQNAAASHRLIVTLEEHSVDGGLGGAVAEILAETPAPRAMLKRIGLPSAFMTRAGTRDYLAEQNGLSAAAITETITQAFAAASSASRSTPS